jgi:hypothetical protein
MCVSGALLRSNRPDRVTPCRLYGLRIGRTAHIAPVGDAVVMLAIRAVAMSAGLAAIHDQAVITAAIQRPAAVGGLEIEQWNQIGLQIV